MIHVVDTFQRLIINQIHRDCLSPWQIYSLRDWGGNWGSEVTKRSEMTIEGLRWQKGDSWGSEVTKGSEVTIEDLKWQSGLRWQLRVWGGLWDWAMRACEELLAAEYKMLNSAPALMSLHPEWVAHIQGKVPTPTSLSTILPSAKECKGVHQIPLGSCSSFSHWRGKESPCLN